jgi:predicted Zn-dependent peptidase
MNKTILLLLCLFGIITAKAQINKIDFVEYDLDNGLHVILHQDKATPIVVVSVMYHVGSKNENPNRTGFAHFFEHLLFEGSENIKRGEFDKYITNAGGANNAYTSQDKTYYYELLPSNQLELGLWLESERMMHAKVDITGVETQREVVKEERRQRYENQPYGSLILETLSRSYKEHPYKWAPIGSMEHLNAAKEEDYQQFYKDFYTPNNAVLSIAGDIDIEATKALVDKYFSTIPVKTPEIYRPTIVEPEMAGVVMDTIYDNIQLPAVVYAYRIPAQGTEDFYAVSMLNTLLAGGQSSRLNKSVIDEQQLAIQAGSFPFELEDPGIALAYGIVNMGVDPMLLQSAMDAEFKKVQDELISEKEFEKLRNQRESAFITGNARIAGIAESLANYYLYYNDTHLINTELDRFLAVTREDIQRVAKKYFNENNRVILHYLPKPVNP